MIFFFFFMELGDYSEMGHSVWVIGDLESEMYLMHDAY